MTHHHLLPHQADFPSCEIMEEFNEILRKSSISMIFAVIPISYIVDFMKIFHTELP